MALRVGWLTCGHAGGGFVAGMDNLSILVLRSDNAKQLCKNCFFSRGRDGCISAQSKRQNLGWPHSFLRGTFPFNGIVSRTESGEDAANLESHHLLHQAVIMSQ